MLIFAEGLLADLHAKTAHGAIRYIPEQVTAVIDSKNAGKICQEVLGYGGNIPIVSSVKEGIKYNPDTLVIGIALVALIAWSILAEMSAVIPILGFVVGLLLVRLCRHYTREIMEDERMRKINEKASSVSYRISTILMVGFAIVFIAMRQTLPYELEIAGVTLSYTACAIILLHLTFYYFYKSRL